MRHPIQKLYYCARTKLLFTGIKGTIQVFDTASGILLRQWEAPELPTIVGKKQKQQQHQKQQQQKEKKPQSTSTDEQSENNGSGTVEIEVATGDEEGVTVKKRKVDDITSSPMVAPATISVAEGKITPEPSQKKKKISFREAPGMGGWSSQKGSNMVTNMVGTSSGRHLVVATNEDKTLRVFRVSELVKGRDVWAEAGGMEGDIEGDLQLLSERQMPKRLCALQLLEKKESMTDEEETSPDGVTIICGDKFGDVYSLPLIHNPEDTKPPTPARGTQNDSSTTPEPERKAPRDTGIITTARNKRAAQKAGEMSSRNSIANLEAKELQFKHKLLLGHVSLLLDVLPVTLQVELPDGEKKLRTWILSADKDEHIRVSRHPHSYVIEGFCLGHNSYVSKLLVPSFDKQTLISGGGDDYLLRWDWKAQRLEQKLDLKEHVAKVLEIVKHNREKIKESSIRGGAMDVDAAEAEEEFQISVTGLWEFRDDVHKRNQVLVSVEGLPALFVFTQRVTGTFEYTTTAGVTGNILDVAVVGNRILVSIDPQSAPFRLPVLGEERDLLVDYLEPEEDKKHFDVITRADAEKVVTTINSKASWEITAEQKAKLNEFLYSAKHLRKFEGEGKGGD